MIYKEGEIIFGISLVADKERNSPLYLSRQYQAENPSVSTKGESAAVRLNQNRALQHQPDPLCLQQEKC